MTEVMQVFTHQNPAPHQLQRKQTRQQRMGRHHRPVHTLTWKPRQEKGDKGKSCLKRHFLTPAKEKIENRIPKWCSCRKLEKGVQNISTGSFYCSSERKTKPLNSNKPDVTRLLAQRGTGKILCLAFLLSVGHLQSSPKLPKQSAQPQGRSTSRSKQLIRW